MNNPVKDDDKDTLKKNLHILEQLRSVAGVKTNTALANILGIKPQNITQAKHKGIPGSWIIQISKQFNIDINQLLASGYGTKGSESDKMPYELPIHVTTMPGLGEAVDLLAEIINSGNTSIINILHSNLVALREVVQLTSSFAKLKRENCDLKDKNARLKDELENSKIDGLERRLEKIENIYLNHRETDSCPERRGVMLQLGQALGYNQDLSKKPLSDNNE